MCCFDRRGHALPFAANGVAVDEQSQPTATLATPTILISPNYPRVSNETSIGLEGHGGFAAVWKDF